MVRDMDLCREILRRMEEHPDALGPVEIEIVGRDRQEIAYHVYLLDQAGLIEAKDAISGDEFYYFPLRLTWHGQDFLDAARNETIWRKAKEKVLGAAGGLAFDVLNAALLAEIRSRTGLDL